MKKRKIQRVSKREFFNRIRRKRSLRGHENEARDYRADRSLPRAQLVGAAQGELVDSPF
jgi:hypothetical protein